MDHGQGLLMPPLPHRSLLSARNVTDGLEIAAWRIDARKGIGRRRFVLPLEPEEILARDTALFEHRALLRRMVEDEEAAASGKNSYERVTKGESG